MAFERDEVTLGYKKRLSYSDTADGTFVPIYGTVEISLPERELGAEEITNDDSPDYHKDYMPGLYEPGTTPFTYVYTKTQFAALEALYQLATVTATRGTATKFWKYTLSDGSVAAWRGFITKHDLPADVEAHLEVEGEMQVLGKITFTAAS